jgi:hypothetical protein
MPPGVTSLSHPNWLLLQWIAYNKDSMLLRKGQFFYGCLEFEIWRLKSLLCKQNLPAQVED